MTTLDFQEVANELRQVNPAGKRTIPAYDAIAAGKTVFIPFPDDVERYEVQNRIRSSLAARKVRVTQRSYEMDGVKGTLVWKVGDIS